MRVRIRTDARMLLAVATMIFSFVLAQSSATASTITWVLSPNIQLSDGGTLNGHFTLNSYGYLNGNSFDLTTAGGSTHFNQDYKSTINASDPNTLTVEFFAPNPAYRSSLTLVFKYSLSSPAWTIRSWVGSADHHTNVKDIAATRMIFVTSKADLLLIRLPSPPLSHFSPPASPH